MVNLPERSAPLISAQILSNSTRITPAPTRGGIADRLDFGFSVRGVRDRPRPASRTLAINSVDSQHVSVVSTSHVVLVAEIKQLSRA